MSAPGTTPVVRIAASGDLHLHAQSSRRFRHSFQAAARHADLLLLAGDLTDGGTVDQARLAAHDLTDLDIPVVAVAGNHDLCGQPGQLVDQLTQVGVTVLHGTGTNVEVRGVRVAVAGTVGAVGGFAPHQITPAGPRPLQALVRHSKHEAALLESALDQTVDAQVRIVLTHYAVHPSTLAGEPEQRYPTLGYGRLGEVIDTAHAAHPVAVVFHGHAHHGTERGATDRGVPIRNVAQPVIRTGYRLYLLHQDDGQWRLADTDRPRLAPTSRPAKTTAAAGGTAAVVRRRPQ